MKKYIAILAGIALLVSCTGEMKQISLPDPIDEAQIEIVQTNTATANVYEFSTNLTQPLILNWDLGNGAKVSAATATGSYPFKGEYTVTPTVLSEGGMTVKTKTITVANDNYDLVNDPTFNYLTGGIDAVNGKGWVLEASAAGHMGCGPEDSWESSWWNAGPYDKDGKGIYDDKIVFTLKGAKVEYLNNGDSYVNEGGKDEFLASYPGATAVQESNGADFLGSFTPAGNWTWTILKENGKEYIVFSDNQAFFMFYTPKPHTYEIMSIDEDRMYLRQQLAGIAWYFRLMREDLEIPVDPEPEKEIAAANYSENFEGPELTVPFAFDQAGSRSAFFYSNPAPVPVNTSAGVCLYEKNEQFYTNMQFVSDYFFDLTAVNKIKVKAFIPSYNDYDTEHAVAGDWIANKKLLPQLAVKLQNNALGGDAWSTQVELVKGNLEMNKWLELEFDFSGSASRTDFDKVVVQFGAEGHTGPGIFFLDDFSFTAEP